MFDVVFINVDDGSRFVYANNVCLSYLQIRDWQNILRAFSQHSIGKYLKIELVPVSTDIF